MAEFFNTNAESNSIALWAGSAGLSLPGKVTFTDPVEYKKVLMDLLDENGFPIANQSEFLRKAKGRLHFILGKIAETMLVRRFNSDPGCKERTLEILDAYYDFCPYKTNIELVKLSSHDPCFSMSVKRGRRPLVLREVNATWSVARANLLQIIRGNARPGPNLIAVQTGSKRNLDKGLMYDPTGKQDIVFRERDSREFWVNSLSEYGRVGLQVKTSGNGVREIVQNSTFLPKRWTPRYKCPIVYFDFENDFFEVEKKFAAKRSKAVRAIENKLSVRHDPVLSQLLTDVRCMRLHRGADLSKDVHDELLGYRRFLKYWIENPNEDLFGELYREHELALPLLVA